MKEFKIAQEIRLDDGKAVLADGTDITLEQTATDLAVFYSNYGADMLLVRDLSNTDEEHEKNIDTVKEMVSRTDAPILLGGHVKRLEDVKKYLYTGAVMAVLDATIPSNSEMIKEAADRFGKDKIAVYVDSITEKAAIAYKEAGAALLVKDHKEQLDATLALPVLYIGTESSKAADYYQENAYGLSYPAMNNPVDFHKEKESARKEHIPVITYEPQLQFSDFKTDAHGLIPVVVQDYKTNEVLMLAYMNEEAFQHTLESGRMTYYSRSRKELWEKGLTSGHFQYWKELSADCDRDTLLAKVYQVGAACHTGKRSCFFEKIVKKDYVERNPYQVFEDVFRVILDRKEHPKEGSYTNYLFDKGIDKILKKCGEEATEIVIAAKNPNPEEIKYEISDFLYHVMVLMAEKGITWEDITTELARR